MGAWQRTGDHGADSAHPQMRLPVQRRDKDQFLSIGRQGERCKVALPDYGGRRDIELFFGSRGRGGGWPERHDDGNQRDGGQSCHPRKTLLAAVRCRPDGIGRSGWRIELETRVADVAQSS